MSDNDNNGVVDLRARMRQREKAIKEMRDANAPNPDRVYEIRMKNGDELQVSGVLMLTGAFFALGVPIGDGANVDFNWAAPVESVDYVVALDDDDLNDD